MNIAAPQSYMSKFKAGHSGVTTGINQAGLPESFERFLRESRKINTGDMTHQVIISKSGDGTSVLSKSISSESGTSLGASTSLNASLESFLASNPTRGQLTDFLATLRVAVMKEQLKQKIELICRVAGIEAPTGADRLMAMQIGLMQEQNAILQSTTTLTVNQISADSKADDSNVLFTAFLGGTLIGAVIAR